MNINTPAEFIGTILGLELNATQSAIFNNTLSLATYGEAVTTKPAPVVETAPQAPVVRSRSVENMNDRNVEIPDNCLALHRQILELHNSSLSPMQIRKQAGLRSVRPDQIADVIRAYGAKPYRRMGAGRITSKIVDQMNAKLATGATYDDLEYEYCVSATTIRKYLGDRR